MTAHRSQPIGPGAWFAIIAGATASALMVIAGLAVLGTVVFIVVSINSYGSNK
jgi:hypothetical protein